MRLSTCLFSLWDLFRDDSSSNRHLWLFWWFDVILRMPSPSGTWEIMRKSVASLGKQPGELANLSLFARFESVKISNRNGQERGKPFENSPILGSHGARTGSLVKNCQGTDSATLQTNVSRRHLCEFNMFNSRPKNGGPIWCQQGKQGFVEMKLALRLLRYFW